MRNVLMNLDRARAATMLLMLALAASVDDAMAQACPQENYTLTTQAGVDAFPQDCSEITGDLSIRDGFSGSITDLTALSGLTSVGRELEIRGNLVLTDVDGLSHLAYVGGDLSICCNQALTNLDGLVGLTGSFGGNVLIDNNRALTNLDGLAGLTEVAGSLSIRYADALVEVNGLSNLRSVGGSFQITSAGQLTDISGLSHLTSVGGLGISGTAVTNLDGLSALHDAGEVGISSNDALTNVDGLSALRSNGPIYLSIGNNRQLANLDGFSGIDSVSSLRISVNEALSNINGLANVRVVKGSLEIEYNPALVNLDGLAGLESVGVQIWGSGNWQVAVGVGIRSNQSLLDVDGLASLKSITGSLEISDNTSLANVNGLSSLTTVGDKEMKYPARVLGPSAYGGLMITSNSQLANLDGLDALAIVGGELQIEGNDVLENLDGLSGLNRLGVLNIADNDLLTDLNGLSRVRGSVDHLWIQGNGALANIDGLAGLTSIEKNLVISGNNVLSNLDGLSGITGSIVGELTISENPALTSLDGLSGLTAVGGRPSGGDLTIRDNDVLTNLDGLSGLASVGGLRINGNGALTNLYGLSAIDSVCADLTISGNSSLANLDGLAALRSVGGDLSVADNPMLSYCSCGLYACFDSECVDGGITMDSNAPSGDCNDNGADLVPNACPSPVPLPIPPELVGPVDGATDVPNAIDLVFRSVDGATRYNVQVSDNPSGSPVLFSSNVPRSPVRFDAPTPGQTYYWRAQAENEGYKSPFSDWWSFTTVRPRPDVPALIEPANGADSLNTSVSLRWLAAENAERYDVQVATSADFESILYKQNTPGLSATFVAPYTMQTYFWRAQAFGPGGASAGFSPVWSFSVGNEGSLVVRDLNPADGATGVPVDPLLSWTEPFESTAQHYHVQLAADTTFETLVVDEDSVVGTSLQVGELAHDTDYCWHVAGVDEGGRFTFTPPACFTTIIAAPDAVTLVSPENGATEVAAYTTFSWQSLDGAAAYHLQVASDAALTSLVIDDSTLTEPAFTVSEPFTYSAGYYWHVRAALDDGLGKTTGLLFGPWSETRSFTVAVGTAIEDEPGIPTAFALYPAYPNPFNPSTTIRYDVPEVATVRLTVFDGLGRRIEELGTWNLEPGTHAVTWDASTHPSGMYFVRMQAGAFTQTRRMILTK